jgi:hypothetical protein
MLSVCCEPGFTYGFFVRDTRTQMNIVWGHKWCHPKKQVSLFTGSLEAGREKQRTKVAERTSVGETRELAVN